MARKSTTPPHNQPQQVQQVNVKVKKKRPMWQWVGIGVIALFVCAGLSNLVNPRPSTTNQAGVVSQPTTVGNTTNPTETIAQAITEPTSPPTLEPTAAPPTPIPPTPGPPTAIAVAPTIAPTTPPEPASNWTASASVSPQEPNTPNGEVRITGKLLKDGKPYQGAVMNLNLEYKSKETDINGAKTKADGTAGQTVQIGSASAGFEVDVNVVFLVDEKVVARTVTSFTPR